jgi:Zn finger protein HypA/HybF involved in hydrogenase expression
MNLASVYAPILKKERQSDGTLLVTGIATDDTLDIDDQICDPSWLERAMPAWFKFGNIREQHSNIAAGIATKYEMDGSRHLVTARVVDPNSVMKVEAGVLKGFSIGIRNPRVSKDKDAMGGRIVDGEIVEVSLVDRPANPSCLIELAKSVGGVVQQTETLIEKESAVERCKECGKAFPSADMKAGMCDKCYGMKADMGTCKMCGVDCAADDMKDGMCGKCHHMKVAEESEMKAAEESSQKPGEESSQKMNEESSRQGGVAGVAGRAADAPMESTEASEEKESSAEMTGSEVTEESTEDSELVEDHSLASIAQTLARLESMLSNMTSSAKETAKSVNAIDERVSKVEKSASSRGPVRTAVKAAAAPDQTDIKAAKAADYRAKAAAVSDPALAQGYLLLAHEAEHSN